MTTGFFTKYPCTRYHKDLAPEGIEIPTAEKEAELGPGWVDTPAAFDPAYVPLTEDPPDGTPFESYVEPAAPPIAYPAMRYARDGGERVINGPDQEEPGWQDHPWSTAELAAGQPMPSTPPAPNGHSTATEPAPATNEGTREPVEPPAAVTPAPEDDGLYRVTVERVEGVLSEITDAAELDDIAARESRNPRGPRKGVLSAIEARREALAAARA